jgi:hypothetical protein
LMPHVDENNRVVVFRRPADGNLPRAELSCPPE